MKAYLKTTTSNGFLLELWPETDEDKADLEKFSVDTAGIHHFRSNGFGYMDPRVSFVISTIGRSD
jgi:hypothetical protein